MLKESKSYKEMLGVVLNVDEVEKRMDRKEIYKKVGNELYKGVLDGIDWDEYENGMWS